MAQVQEIRAVKVGEGIVCFDAGLYGRFGGLRGDSDVCD